MSFLAPCVHKRDLLTYAELRSVHSGFFFSCCTLFSDSLVPMQSVPRILNSVRSPVTSAGSPSPRSSTVTSTFASYTRAFGRSGVLAARTFSSASRWRRAGDALALQPMRMPLLPLWPDQRPFHKPGPALRLHLGGRKAPSAHTHRQDNCGVRARDESGQRDVASAATHCHLLEPKPKVLGKYAAASADLASRLESRFSAVYVCGPGTHSMEP